MEDRIDRVLIDRHTIADRVRTLAEEIASDLREETRGDGEPRITLVAILTGSLIFLADLIRHLPIMIRIRLITVSSYPGKSTSSQGVTLTGALPDDLAGQHVLVVDDILDSGKTMRKVREELSRRHPASLRFCMLLRKNIPAALAEKADYIGFDIPDEFIVGYGLDFDDYYRNLPDIVTLKGEYLR